jgi:hypothetical protein
MRIILLHKVIFKNAKFIQNQKKIIFELDKNIE